MYVSSYLCLRDPESKSTGFPVVSSLRSVMMDSISTNRFELFLTAYMMAICTTIESSAGNNSNQLTEKEIAEQFRKSQPWLETAETAGSKTIFYQQVVEQHDLLKAIDSVQLDSLRKKCLILKEELSSDPKMDYWQFLRAKFEDRLKHLVANSAIEMLTLIFDESNCLTKSFLRSSDVSFYRVVRRSFVTVLNDLPVVAVFADTSSTIVDYFINEREADSSNRLVTDKKVQPFVDVFFIDHVAQFGKKSLVKYVNKLRSYASVSEQNRTTVSLCDFIRQRDPYESIYLYGRPLWISYTNDQDVLKWAQSKLIRHTFGTDGELVKEKEEPTQLEYGKKLTDRSLAIIASRTTLFNGFSVTNSRLACNLVNSYMATLCHISDDGSQLDFRYVSEPILAEAGAKLMRKWPFQMESLVKRLVEATSAATPIIKNTGEIGELVVEFILLAAKDSADFLKGEQAASSPVTVREFLVALVGEENYKTHFRVSDDFSKGLVAFNHFRKMFMGDLSRSSIVMDFLGRCAAGKLPTNFAIVDLFIPVVLPDNEISFIFIQVKNQADSGKGQRACFKKNLLRMTARGVAEANVFEPSSGREGTSEFDQLVPDEYLSILMSIGAETKSGRVNFQSLLVDSNQRVVTEKSEPATSNHVLIYGLDNALYPNLEALDALKKLAKSSRDAVSNRIGSDESYRSLMTGSGFISQVDSAYQQLWKDAAKQSP